MRSIASLFSKTIFLLFMLFSQISFACVDFTGEYVRELDKIIIKQVGCDVVKITSSRSFDSDVYILGGTMPYRLGIIYRQSGRDLTGDFVLKPDNHFVNEYVFQYSAQLESWDFLSRKIGQPLNPYPLAMAKIQGDALSITTVFETFSSELERFEKGHLDNTGLPICNMDLNDQIASQQGCWKNEERYKLINNGNTLVKENFFFGDNKQFSQQYTRVLPK